MVRTGVRRIPGITPAPRPFIHPFVCVRMYASASMARKIVSNPRDAPRIPCACFGKIDTLPYTNSMCTQYTSKEACPN